MHNQLCNNKVTFKGSYLQKRREIKKSILTQQVFTGSTMMCNSTCLYFFTRGVLLQHVLNLFDLQHLSVFIFDWPLTSKNWPRRLETLGIFANSRRFYANFWLLCVICANRQISTILECLLKEWLKIEIQRRVKVLCNISNCPAFQ